MVIALAVVCTALAAAAIYFAVRFFAVKISLREIGEPDARKTARVFQRTRRAAVARQRGAPPVRAPDRADGRAHRRSPQI